MSDSPRNHRQPAGLIFCVFFTFAAMAFPAGYGGGSGTEENPYQIWTAEQMNTIGTTPSDWDKSFKLMADIDMSALNETPFNIIGKRIDYGGPGSIPFTGVFDGAGKTISNMKLNSPGIQPQCSVGLFGYLTGEIRNLRLVNVEIRANANIAVGALVGFSLDGRIRRCSVTGFIEGHDVVGGLVGCGGIIEESISSGQVFGNDYVGGLVGTYGAAINSYSDAIVTGNNRVGGLMGVGRSIINCYSSGEVFGNANVGGLTGMMSDRSSTQDSFWDIQTSHLSSSSTGVGKTTLQMMNAETFRHWGLCNNGIWTIQEGVDYPRLSWQSLPGQPIVSSGPYYGGGEGTIDNPYLIFTVEQFYMIGLRFCDWGKHFKLMADIDLSEINQELYQIGNSDVSFFSGSFDGNGYVIHQVNLRMKEGNLCGLFGVVRGELKNIHISQGCMKIDVGSNLIPSCYPHAGILAGTIESDGRVKDCSIQDVTLQCEYKGNPWDFINESIFIGGFVGTNMGTISNSFWKGEIHGIGSTGSIAGNNWGLISNCSGEGAIISSATGYTGGIVGWNRNQILDCNFEGSIESDAENIWGCCIGGIVGYNGPGYWGQAQIEGCQANCRIEFRQDRIESSYGAIVGVNDEDGVVLASSSSGNLITKTKLEGFRWDILCGGLVGVNMGAIENCRSTVSVLSSGVSGGLIGRNEGRIHASLSEANDIEGEYAGGIVGKNRANGLVSCCYSDSNLTGIQAGGLVSYNEGTFYHCYSISRFPNSTNPAGIVFQDNGVISECFWDVDVSGVTIGENGQGLSSSAMKSINTFWAWGSDGVWTINDRLDYPRLIWEGSDGTIIPFFPSWEGAGSSEEPYLISNIHELNAIGAFPTKWGSHFRLVNDIDAGTKYIHRFNLIGGGPGYPFTGTFDGGGHKILNLTYITNDESYVALFRCIGENAQIRDLGLVDPNIYTVRGTSIASMVGYLGPASTITRCYTKGGCVHGDRRVGGLVGWSSTSAKLDNCYSRTYVHGKYDVGGLVGSHYATMKASYAAGKVEGLETTGGLVGWNQGYSQHCVWDIESTGQTRPGANAVPYSIIQMYDAKNFTDLDWDFINIWDNGENNTYPYIRTFSSADLNKDHVVNILDLAIMSEQWLKEWNIDN
jgi:hypothetical protein